MKKLIFVISQLYKGGAETALVNLLNNLDYKKYEVDLLILCQTPAPDAVSLIESVNKNVRICDAYAEYQKLTLWSRIKAKLEYTTEQKTAFYLPALEFVKNKYYDWAFFIGEWYSPAFVAYHTNAKIKAAWIHCDLSKTQNFDQELYFYFYECFDYFIFVSYNALTESIKKYPFLKEKAVTIYNVNDVKSIRKKSNEPIDDYKFNNNIPTLLTCANFRPEKNHIKQIKVMAELKRRGIEINWVNIGSMANKKVVDEVYSLVHQEGLENNFIILGAKDNPYKYMNQADAITVLSDYESWSMVITEAKILGIPVIATKTAGALEQIEHNKTGMLADFDVNQIADEVEKFITNPELAKQIRENLNDFDNTNEILCSFDNLIETGQHHSIKEDNGSILFVIDDINFKGGAHAATLLQIKELLKQNKKVTIFSHKIPTCEKRIELPGVRFLSWRDIPQYIHLHRRIVGCLTNKFLSSEEKKFRMDISIKTIIRKEKNIKETMIYPLVTNLFSNYNTVCVMSEASFFRKYVAESTCKRKIQWIHTDYVAWSEFNDWTRNITAKDELIYSKFDYIILLSESIRYKFIEKMPSLRENTRVIKNLLPVNDIIIKGSFKVQPYPKVHFVSVGRLSEEKAFERLILILCQLYEEGYKFIWEIIGDGPSKDKLQDLINQNGLEKIVLLLGHKKNPYKYISNAQVFSLLSSYEGTPNTIYEALILGVPVLASNVGGISEQIVKGKTGWIVENDRNSIYEGIKHILEHQNEINAFKKNLEQYEYNIKAISNQLKVLF